MEELFLRHRLHLLVGVLDGGVVVLDGGGHVAGQNLAGVVVQRRHRHLARVNGAAEFFIADDRQGVGQDRHLMTVLLDVFRGGIPHQRPALDEPHPGDIGKKMAFHHSILDFSKEYVAVGGGHPDVFHHVVQVFPLRQHLHVVGGVAEEPAVPGLLEQDGV